MVEVLHNKPKGSGFYSLCDYLGRTVTLGSTQPLTEMSTRVISWEIKVAGA